MLKLPTRVDNKVILIAPLLLGVYLAVMYPLHGVILAIISSRFGVNFTNEYPLLTAFLLYVASIPLAVLLNGLLVKRIQSYDEKLIAALVSNVAFSLTIAFMFSLKDGSVITLIVLPIVLSFFGFLMSALFTILIESIEAKYLKYKSL